VGITISNILGTDGRLYSYRTQSAEAFRAFPWSREDIAVSLPTREANIAAIERCTHCGVCEERCPRSLPVMALLQGVLPPLRGIVGIFHEVLGAQAQ
jgi:ferredoxin